MPIVIIDDPAAVFVGSWGSVAGSGGYNNEWQYHASGSGSNTASWVFTGLTAGVTYNVGLTWVQNSNRATNTPWTIYDSDGTTSLASGTLNQQNAPTGQVWGGVHFQLLGSGSTISGTSLTLTITDNANNFVIADAALTYPNTEFTSQQSGTWSDTTSASPWYLAGSSTPCPIPGSGDTATIEAGHAITISSPLVIGSGSGTALTMVGGSGGGTSLTISSTLEIDGSFSTSATGSTFNTLTLSAGSGITLNGNSGVTPTLNLNSGSGTFTFTVNGSSGSHCYITTKNGTAGTNGVIASDARLVLTIAYCDFTNLGINNSTAGITFNLNSSGDASVNNCTFTGCSLKWAGTGVGATATHSFSDNTFSNSILFSDTPANHSVSISPGTWHAGAIFNLVRCGFDKVVVPSFSSSSTPTLTDLIFGGATYSLINTGGTNARWLYYVTSGSGPDLDAGTYTDIYYFTNSADSNQHGIGLADGSTLTGMVLDPLIGATSSAAGDAPFIANTCTVQFCLLLPIASGTYAGDGYWQEFAHDDGSHTGQSFLHNTTAAPDANYVLGEGSAPVTNGIVSWAANLTLQNSYISCLTPATPPIAQFADYNARSGSGGSPYSVYQTGSPGAHDLTSFAPFFVDSSRSFLTWCQVVRGHNSGTVSTDVAAGLADLIANPSLLGATPSGLLFWVREGYRPTNPAASAASYPGDASTADANGNAWPGGSPGIGAMAYAPASTGWVGKLAGRGGGMVGGGLAGRSGLVG